MTEIGELVPASDVDGGGAFHPQPLDLGEARVDASPGHHRPGQPKRHSQRQEQRGHADLVDAQQ